MRICIKESTTLHYTHTHNTHTLPHTHTQTHPPSHTHTQTHPPSHTHTHTHTHDVLLAVEMAYVVLLPRVCPSVGLTGAAGLQEATRGCTWCGTTGAPLLPGSGVGYPGAAGRYPGADPLACYVRQLRCAIAALGGCTLLFSGKINGVSGHEFGL